MAGSAACAPDAEGDALHRVAPLQCSSAARRASSPNPRGSRPASRARRRPGLESVEAVGKHVSCGSRRLQCAATSHGTPLARPHGTATVERIAVARLSPRFEARSGTGRAHGGRRPPALGRRANGRGRGRRLAVRRVDHAACSATSVDQRVSPASGTLAAELSGRRGCPLAAGSARDDDELARVSGGRAAMLASVGHLPPQGVSGPDTTVPPLWRSDRSRGLGDANRTAYWCGRASEVPERGREGSGSASRCRVASARRTPSRPARVHARCVRVSRARARRRRRVLPFAFEEHEASRPRASTSTAAGRDSSRPARHACAAVRTPIALRSSRGSRAAIYARAHAAVDPPRTTRSSGPSSSTS
jgi:hypothetical protein